MSKITQEQLKNGVSGSNITGVLLVRSYSIQLTKNNKEYIAGTLQSGVEIQFKAWNNSRAFSELKDNDYHNTPVYITGSFDNFGGIPSIILDTITAVSDFELSDFLPIKYNADAYLEALKNEVSKSVSEKCMTIANNILFNNTDLLERFKIEFAAQSHHDNCKSGLLAHTYKVVVNLKFMLNNYASIVKKEDGTLNQDLYDLLILGALLHDIGKTKEMEFGVYQSCSSVTHRYLGIEFVTPYKEVIIDSYNEDWYYQLISVFLQHHDEFDDKSRTLVSYLVFKADYFDSEFTMIQQLLESPVVRDTTKNIKYNGKWLQLL